MGKVSWFSGSLGFVNFISGYELISELEKGAGSRYPLNGGTNS